MTSRQVRRKPQMDPETLTLVPTDEIDERDPQRYTCCNVSKMCTRWTVEILALVTLIIAAAVGIVAYVSTSNTIAVQRMTIVGVSSTLSGLLSGLMTFNEGSRSISWNLFLQNGSLPFSGLSLGIFGPITTSPGVLYVPLCGGATGVVCVANATAQMLLPQGYSLTMYIVNIRQFPMWYDVKLCDSLANCYIAPLGISAGAP